MYIYIYIEKKILKNLNNLEIIKHYIKNIIFFLFFFFLFYLLIFLYNNKNKVKVES